MKIDINNNILLWAVERAGYSLDEISNKIPQFVSWLEGKKKPTIKQLENFTQKVHLPFGYLFLDNIPTEKIPIPYFRKKAVNKISLNVYDTILLLQQRMTWLSEFLKEEGNSPLPFVGFNAQSNDVMEVVHNIHTTLELGKDWAKQSGTWEEALKHLTKQVENTGIIVIFNSIVGNNTHRSISVKECRGFVLVDEYAPFMFINAADSKAAQMFTIAHELAHIWIGKSAGFDLRELSPAEDETEKFCDQVAAEFLVPAEEFLTQWRQKNQNFGTLARYFKVSELVVARRALDFQVITRDDFLKFYSDYLERIRKKENQKDSGGDFYLTQNRRLGSKFSYAIYQALRENKLLYRDAWRLTSLKGQTFDKFIKKLI